MIFQRINTDFDKSTTACGRDILHTYLQHDCMPVISRFLVGWKNNKTFQMTQHKKGFG